MEYCERVQVIVPTARITVASCRECVFYLGVNSRPLFSGDNHNLQVQLHLESRMFMKVLQLEVNFMPFSIISVKRV